MLLLNKITYYFLNRAYAQLACANNLQNESKVAEFLEDYYAEYCTKSTLK